MLLPGRKCDQSKKCSTKVENVIMTENAMSKTENVTLRLEMKH